MGDPALADPALVPDMQWSDDPDWAGHGKTIHVSCDYRLVVDNLMDLTYETFVHGSSIGNDHVAEAPFDVTYGDRTVTVYALEAWHRGAAVLGRAFAKIRSGRPLADHPFPGARYRWRRFRPM
jgi:phenylpropionate dioxygenase-like ring-hydroxylating dioxygenase large terminal subunit